MVFKVLGFFRFERSIFVFYGFLDTGYLIFRINFVLTAQTNYNFIFNLHEFTLPLPL